MDVERSAYTAQTGPTASSVGVERAPTRNLREDFDRALAGRENSEQSDTNADEDAGHTSPGKAETHAEALPSALGLMQSLFAAHVSAGEAAQDAGADIDALVDRLVDKILVSEPGSATPEVRITLGDGVLNGAELCLTKAADGQLFVRLTCADSASFQTAVDAQDSLRFALQRTHGNVRVEVGQRGGEGEAGDMQRRSQGLDYLEDAGTAGRP